MIQILARIVGLDYPKVVFIGLFLCGVYYILYFQDAATQLDTKLNRLKSTLSQEEAKAKDTKETESRAEIVKKNVAELSKNLDTVQKRLPSNITTSDVISFIEFFSRETQIQISSKTPMNPVREDITEKLPVSISFSTSYSKLGQFFVAAANYDRITTIPKYSIRRSADRESQTLQIDMEINGYRAFETKEDVIKDQR
ncbi:MAG: type 4a pilus biogenesis protein PilO [Bdellovibrionaceae bacterium]|nr:type 4a pilus biogenesis protein PilO [Pseudobdellovibrionaceae bacterium]